MSDASPNVYDQRNIETMEMVWGRGYMSAGGDAEVARILEGVDLAPLKVLDLGCGLGGAAVAMARDLGAREVVAADVDAGVLGRARQLVAENEVTDSVLVQQIDPGPLPFPDAHFDLVYLNAVSCHCEDLAAFFGDVHRVLRPGGQLRGSDWFKLGDNPAFEAWDELLRERGLNFYFVSRDQFASALREAKFEVVDFVDRTCAVAQIAERGLRHVEAELREKLLERLGRDGYGAFHAWAQARRDTLVDGGMAHGHFHARA